MLHVDTSWDEVLRTVATTSFSRLPVYRGTRERVVGMLRVKDLVAHFAAAGPVPLERLARPISGVPADLPADGVVTLLRDRRTHQGVVVDASGCALGLVTIQDVLDELLATVQAHGARSTERRPSA
jgi:CBS domain containing-hemolysin-like protein